MTERLIVHSGSVYTARSVPEIAGHHLDAYEGPAHMHNVRCTCGEWRASDGCGPCVNQRFLEHLAAAGRLPAVPADQEA